MWGRVDVHAVFQVYRHNTALQVKRGSRAGYDQPYRHRAWISNGLLVNAVRSVVSYRLAVDPSSGS